LLNAGAFTAILATPVKTGIPTQRRHLAASSIAIAIMAVVLVGGVFYCDQIEQRYVHALAPDLSEAKLQGVVLQKKAFAQPDLLVLYGSSELAKEMPNNAAQFFQDYPTGFRVFPVGQPGTTSLAVVQKVAALGEGIKDRKVAFSLSPGWFFTESFDPKWYEGNFSHLQAYEFAFSHKLSRGLKRDIARRMLDYPKTLESHWLLEFTLSRLAGGSHLDRALYAAVWPLGQMQNTIGRVQDHFEAALHIVAEDAKLDEQAHRGLRALNWNDLIKRAAQFAINKTAVQAKRSEIAKKKPKLALESTEAHTQSFLKKVTKAKEWNDLDLLLRTFRELGANPLLLSMPVEDIRLEVYGVSPKARTAYLRRLEGLAEKHDVPLLDFRDHQKDSGFLVDFLDHLSPQGWLYYNKALDDFYHARED
jgi:D-alanine transfer protein